MRLTRGPVILVLLLALGLPLRALSETNPQQFFEQDNAETIFEYEHPKKKQDKKKKKKFNIIDRLESTEDKIPPEHRETFRRAVDEIKHSDSWNEERTPPEWEQEVTAKKNFVNIFEEEEEEEEEGEGEED